MKVHRIPVLKLYEAKSSVEAIAMLKGYGVEFRSHTREPDGERYLERYLLGDLKMPWSYSLEDRNTLVIRQ